MKIAINGVGIAGPTLAYWLLKSGHDVLLIEEAPQLRTGGYIIDFWGVGYDIAEKMGIIPQIRELGYQVQEVRYVDQNGRAKGGFKADVFSRLAHGRFTSLRRSELAALIYRALDGKVETIFGDSVARVEEEGHGARVSFDRGAPREVDLVIGADGLHSRVRQLVFGQQNKFDVSLSYNVAAFEVKGYHPRDELVYVSYAIPGRQASRFSMRDDMTLFLFVFHDEYLPGGWPAATDRKSALEKVFADAGWECPRMLAAMEKAGEIYFDRVSQIRMERWAKCRTALIGDAAACVSLLAGEGTGLAMAEAYVLAGELCVCNGDHGAAFERYQTRLMPLLARKQRAAVKFAPSFCPRTAFGIKFRNVATRLLRIHFLAELLIGRSLLEHIELPEYPFCRRD